MELIESVVWQALRAAGLNVLPVAADLADVILEYPSDPSADASRADTIQSEDRPREENLSVRMQVLARSHPLAPSDLREMADRFRSGAPALVVVPTATPAARDAAARLGWSLIAANPRSPQGPQGQVLLPGRSVSIGAARRDPDATPELRARPGRVPWGTLTVLRRLAEGTEGTQAQLAELAGVTQARVSQVLKELITTGLVSRSQGQGPRYAVLDWDGVLRRWLAHYPGPGGISTYWYGLDGPVEQAKAVVAFLRQEAVRPPTEGLRSSRDAVPPARRQSLDPVAVVSGDVAADQVAPWRRPQRAMVYAHRGADLAGLGLTPTSERDATLVLTVPRDPGVWPARADADVWSWPETPDLPLADPLQILWDVRRSPGPDRDQAADRLLAALRALASRKRVERTTMDPSSGDGDRR